MVGKTLAALVLALVFLGAGPAAANDQVIRIGVTPVILKDQSGFLDAWRDYLEEQTGHPVEFVRRGTYGEIVDLALRERIHFAWLCGFPYVREDGNLDLLAVPVYQGEPLYQSYIIVGEHNDAADGLAGLEGAVFAFSDPNSNSGWLYPETRLLEQGQTSDEFFSRTFFTYGHRNVVEAVAEGLADAGAVDGYVWETLRQRRPELTDRTRVVEKSPQFGFPPLVATGAADSEMRRSFRAALHAMNNGAEGKSLLEALNLDGFTEGDDAWFDGIRDLSRRISGDDRPSL